MRIINRTEFLALPPNTLFSKYEPSVFGDLCIKMESTDYNDFYEQRLKDAIDTGDSYFHEVLDSAQQSQTSIPMDLDCMGRDGLFEDDQLFAVWEPEDVRALIARLSLCLPRGEELEGMYDGLPVDHSQSQAT